MDSQDLDIGKIIYIYCLNYRTSSLVPVDRSILICTCRFTEFTCNKIVELK